MTKLTNFLESALVDHMIGNAYTAPATIYAALFTANPGEAGGGTEVIGNGYSRQAITWSAESGGVSSNSAVVAFTASGGSWGTVTAMALMDASVGGNMLAYDVDLADNAVSDGNVFQFAAGQIKFGFEFSNTAPALLRGVDGVARFNPPMLLNRINQSNANWNTNVGTGAVEHAKIIKAGNLDANNFPTALGVFSHYEASAMSYSPPAYDQGMRMGGSPTGTRAYVLKWTPTGNTVSVNASDGTLTVTDDTTAGRIEFDFTDPVSTPGADVFIRVRITGIVAPFTSMVMVPADQEAAFDGGEKWDADFKTEAAQSRILRFMDTQQTNEGTHETYAEINDTGQRTYSGRAVPLDWMIDLCNDLKRDGYFCLPNNFSDADLTTMINRIRTRSDSIRHNFIEGPDNEPWNSTFKKVFDAMEREGVTLWHTGHRHAVGALSGGTGNGRVLIEGMNKTIPTELVMTAHPFTTGDKVYITRDEIKSPTKYNGGVYTITVEDVNTISLDGTLTGTSDADFADDGLASVTPVGTFTTGTDTLDFIPLTIDGSGTITSGWIDGVPSGAVDGTFNMSGLPGAGTTQITIAVDGDSNFGNNSQIRNKYQAYRAAEMFKLVEDEYGVNFGVTGKTCFGTQTGSDRVPGHYRPAWNKYKADTSRTNYSDLIDYLMVTTYCSTIRLGNTTDDVMLRERVDDSQTAHSDYRDANTAQATDMTDRSEEAAWNAANVPPETASSQGGTTLNERIPQWEGQVAHAADPEGDSSEPALRGGVAVYEGGEHNTYRDNPPRDAVVLAWLADASGGQGGGFVYSDAKAAFLKTLNAAANTAGLAFCADFGFIGPIDFNEGDKPWPSMLYAGHDNPVRTAWIDMNGLGTMGGDKLDISWDDGRPDSDFV